MIKALFDTNVLYSAMISPNDSCANLLRMAALGYFTLVISEDIFDELEDILARPKTKNEIVKGLSKKEIKRFLKALEANVEHAPKGLETHQVPHDPKDNHVLSAAVNQEVDYLVSGDKHLLSLKKSPELGRLGLMIVSPKEFSEAMRSKSIFG